MKKSAIALVIAVLAASAVDAKEPIQSGMAVLPGLEKFAAGMSEKGKRDLGPDVVRILDRTTNLWVACVRS